MTTSLALSEFVDVPVHRLPLTSQTAHAPRTSHLAHRTSHIRRVRQLLYATSDGRLRLSHCNDSTDTATATATATARRAKHQLAYSPDLTQIVYTYHGNVCIKVCHLSNLDIGEHKKLFTVKDIYKLPN